MIGYWFAKPHLHLFLRFYFQKAFISFSMRHIKLLIISILVFYGMVWGFSLLFPGTTVLSRVVSLPLKKNSLMKPFEAPEFYKSWLIGNDTSIRITTAKTSFYPNNLFNSERQPGADTIFFKIEKGNQKPINGGVAFYFISADTTITQLFYVFNTAWYKPWDKMATMMNDKRFGNSMDTALELLKKELALVEP